MAQEAALKICGNCQRKIGLSKTGICRTFDFRTRTMLTFHNRNCKREWKAKRKVQRARELAVRQLMSSSRG